MAARASRDGGAVFAALIAVTALMLPTAANASPAARPSAPSPHGPLYRTAPPMDVTVRNRLMPQMSNLLDQMLREGRAMRLDGVPVFEAHDQFLPGKIAGALALLLLETPRTDPNFDRYVAGFRRISDMTVDDENHSWGIYYYVSALYRLKQAGLLERAVSPETLAKLRTKLDWRLFVRPDFTLIDLPNNYYGVAFSIARLRMLLGWEDASGSDKLFARMIDHYRRYSGAYGFADETDGEGRFDRYSVLLIGEIAQRLIETGTPAPPEVKQALRRSVDLMLLRFNMRGEGWEYGRSIGPYGETCFLEVMTAAAKLGLLSAREQAMAYAFSARIAARYMDFWVDPTTGSVNMWDKGRRTDDYRSKNRILGENLSLARQYIYTNEEWNEFGFRNRAPDPAYADWLARLPKSTLTWFARGRFDRALLTVRDGGHVIGLPLVNGAQSQHMHNPYFPIPFSPGMLSGAADATWPQLVPRVTLKDGTVLMPLAWFRDVRVTRHGDTTILTYRQDLVDRMGKPAPVEDGRLQVTTRYEFRHGRITRSDVLTPAHPLAVKALDMVFASFSTGARRAAPGEVRFADGEVGRFEARGFDSCAAAPVDAAPYRSPSGPFKSLVTCASGPFSLSRPVSLSWTISYR